MEMSCKKLLAVFWDVDGTLADTELYGHRIAFNLSFKNHGLDWVWNKRNYLDLLRISGGYNRIIHYRNLINEDVSDETCAQIQSTKRVIYKELVESGRIKPRTGVVRLIEELYLKDVEQYIVTTSGRESLLPFLKTTLNKHFHIFSGNVAYEDVIKHKPYPDAYQLAIKISNKSPEHCIAIEDSNIGVKSAKAANLNCLLTLPPWHSSDNTINKNANACVDSLGNIQENTNLIYGKSLVNDYVDFEYLTKIIN